MTPLGLEAFLGGVLPSILGSSWPESTPPLGCHMTVGDPLTLAFLLEAGLVDVQKVLVKVEN